MTSDKDVCGTDPAPARLTVGIVSAGRVGSALGAALERAGHVVFGVSAISDASLRRAETRLPDSRILPAAEVAAHSELLILSVPDSELAGLISGLAAAGAVRPGTIVVQPPAPMASAFSRRSPPWARCPSRFIRP